MTIRVKLFSVLRERAGVSELRMEVPPQITVAGVAHMLLEKLPVLAPFLPRVAFAVNLTYAGPQVVLEEGDELAILPPVSGG